MLERHSYPKDSPSISALWPGNEASMKEVKMEGILTCHKFDRAAQFT